MDLDAYHSALKQGFSEDEASSIAFDAWEERIFCEQLQSLQEPEEVQDDPSRTD